ncbi:MAG: hypothetical protein C0478_12460 [Planctomyces sp.]|nr:hypothetical protein [Planctomyces sp.]
MSSEPPVSRAVAGEVENLRKNDKELEFSLSPAILMALIIPSSVRPDGFPETFDRSIQQGSQGLDDSSKLA